METEPVEPVDFNLEADDKEPDCELIDVQTWNRLIKRVYYSAN